MIEEYKKTVEKALVNYFDEILNNKTHKFAKKTIESMKYTTCLNGKRLRAIMCLEACNLVSNDYYPAIPSACALEMLHAQSLIHDDLPAMDNDDLRRGKPSNHKVFGDAVAILAGDALISLGGQIIIEKTPKTVPCDRVLTALNKYLEAAGIYGIVAGQTADIEAENGAFGEQDGLIEYIQKYKTGALFLASVLIGGIIGGAGDSQLNALKDFAINFGIAFQMADDILDVISTPEVMGKTTGKDEYENKLTYVKRFGLQGAKEKFTGKINECYDILEKNGLKSAVFNRIINSMQEKVFN